MLGRSSDSAGAIAGWSGLDADAYTSRWCTSFVVLPRAGQARTIDDIPSTASSARALRAELRLLYERSLSSAWVSFREQPWVTFSERRSLDARRAARPSVDTLENRV